MQFSTDEDKELIDFLQSYLNKLQDETLSVEEKINLIEFYVNHHNNFIKQKQDMPDSFSESQLQQLLTLGWVYSLSINDDS